jgi:hypothetical protein
MVELKVKYLEKPFGIWGQGIGYMAQGFGLLDIIKADYDVNTLRDSLAVEESEEVVSTKPLDL